ncbi:hypothetical protein FB451DRAFT_157223, partial [Mycena latifolia]
YVLIAISSSFASHLFPFIHTRFFSSSIYTYLSPTGPFTTTILLPPGTHHFRFIVDGQTVVAPATEIPNAVDDQGFIANYVAVPGPVGAAASTAATSPTASTPSSATTSKPPSATVSPSVSVGAQRRRRRPSLPVHPDGSFWARSSAGSSEDVRLAERIVGSGGGSRGHGAAAGWTSEIPEALVRAAAQEEAWLDAQAAYHAHPHHAHHVEGNGRGRHIVLNGFVPEPSIPVAPRLPRHLERLILNRPSPGVVIPRVGTTGVGSGSSMNAVGAAPAAVGGGAGTGPSPALRVTTASGTDVSVPMMSFSAAAGEEGQASQHPPSPGRIAVAAQMQMQAQAQAAPAVAGGIPLIADDPSVLQTPSHAVLYHLCTSSIRDKMIAVGASTRYRQK